jgi:protein-S-isoprenylcysteine O-methyltransferase Ste14
MTKPALPVLESRYETIAKTLVICCRDLMDEIANHVLTWLRVTPNRTFALFPLLTIATELFLRRGNLVIVGWGTPLLAWGYLQYHLTGLYRRRHGGGGPGVSNPPKRLIVTGPYRYTRNPMYLGHLIFMLGVSITLWSAFALILFLFHVVWFHRRVLKDERRLEEIFGDRYAAYRRNVSRWIPL